jgi:hypothetical protein
MLAIDELFWGYFPNFYPSMVSVILVSQLVCRQPSEVLLHCDDSLLNKSTSMKSAVMFSVYLTSFAQSFCSFFCSIMDSSNLTMSYLGDETVDDGDDAETMTAAQVIAKLREVRIPKL